MAAVCSVKEIVLITSAKVLYERNLLSLVQSKLQVKTPLNQIVFYRVDDIFFVLPIVEHFTVSDVKFLGTIRFLKKGFHRYYFLDVVFHIRIM